MELLQSLQSAKPKQILQSLAFLTSHSTQSLTKTYLHTTPRSKRSTAEKIETENSLLPLKQSLVANSEKLLSLQNTIANLPKKEYATTEAKCRALRAARTEALDRLDEIISSSTEPESVNEEWNDDVNAAKELIVAPERFMSNGLGTTNFKDKITYQTILRSSRGNSSTSRKSKTISKGIH